MSLHLTVSDFYLSQELIRLVRSLTAVGSPALVGVDVLHVLDEHLVDGVVPQVPGELSGVSGDHWSFATEIVVVNEPSLAILQPQCLADLPLGVLQGGALCPELELLGECYLLEIWPTSHIVSADMLDKLLVRDCVDLENGAGVDYDHDLDELNVGLVALEHVLAGIGAVVVQIFHDLGADGSVL